MVEADLSRSADVIARDVLITEHSVAGRPIDAVAIPERYGVVITRVRRDAIEFVPKGDFVLEIGDQVRVVGQEPEVLAFAEKAGVNERRIHETGLATFFAGLVLGTLLGLVGLPLPWGGTFRLGLAGGPLLAGLVLGHFGRIGRFHIHVPPAARYLLRELGLVFFLVSAGTAAGAEAVPVILSQGLRSVFLAVLIVLTAMGTAFALAYVVFRHSTAATVGVTCGAMTSTPGLGAASHQFDNDVPALTYATVYPFALVFKTALVQVLIGLLS